MKILVVLDKYFAVSETFIFNRVKALEGHDVVLLGRKWINRDTIPIPKRVTAIYHYQSLLFTFKYKLYQFGILSSNPEEDKLDQLLKDHAFDLVILHYGMTVVNYRHSLRKTDIPFIVYFHGIDLSAKLKNEDYRQKLSEIARKASYCITNSQFLAKRIGELKISEERIKIIKNGVDTARIDQLSSEVEKDHDRKVIRILHAGRIVPKKGILDLVSVVNELIEESVPVELMVIGAGYGKPELKEFVEKIGSPKAISLLGEMTHEHVLKEMLKADVFVLNSRTDSSGETEGLPNSILEAMYCKCAVISTSHAGIPEIIVDDENGILVPERDNKALKVKIKKLIQEPDKRKSLAGNAHQTVEKKFTYDRMKNQILELVDSLKTS